MKKINISLSGTLSEHLAGAAKTSSSVTNLISVLNTLHDVGSPISEDAHVVAEKLSKIMEYVGAGGNATVETLVEALKEVGSLSIVECTKVNASSVCLNLPYDCTYDLVNHSMFRHCFELKFKGSRGIRIGYADRNHQDGERLLRVVFRSNVPTGAWLLSLIESDITYAPRDVTNDFGRIDHDKVRLIVDRSIGWLNG